MALGIRCEQSSHWPMHSRSNPVIDHSNYESPCTPPTNQQPLDTNMTDRRRTLIYLVAANFMLYFGFRIWQTTINNFAVEDLGIGALDVGWMQSLREIPGLMGFLLGFLAIYLAETRIMAIDRTQLSQFARIRYCSTCP